VQGIGAWNGSQQTISARGEVLRRLNDCFVNQWKMEVNRDGSTRGVGGNKLRTYKMLKREFGTTSYLQDHHITRMQRSALAKFRCGVAPLRLETGRFEGLPVEERLCPVCNSETETELHAVIKCHAYDDLRTVVFNAAINLCDGFMALSDCDKLVFILSESLLNKQSANLCYRILKRRRELLYMS